MSIVLIVTGILIALDLGVWSITYRWSTADEQAWRVLDANLAVIIVNVAATTLVVIGALVLR